MPKHQRIVKVYRQQKIDRFIENFPKQFGESLRGYLKRYEKGEATVTEIIEDFTNQIEATCNTIDALQGKLYPKKP